jgi:hypothetical protein
VNKWIKPPSDRASFWTQVITWSVFFLLMAWKMPEPANEVATCPSVLASLTDSDGIPKNPVGFALGVVLIGFLWFLTGLLAAVYVKWPRLGSVFRVMAARVMGPQARRLGPLVMAGGIALFLLLQLGCEVTG